MRLTSSSEIRLRRQNRFASFDALTDGITDEGDNGGIVFLQETADGLGLVKNIGLRGQDVRTKVLADAAFDDLLA